MTVEVPRNNRVVDTREYVGALKALVEQGHEVSLLVSGDSMMPFLKNGRDNVIISPVSAPLRRGDIAFFQRSDGRYIMHRICRVRGDMYWMVGDAQTWIEGPVRRGQIFGVITAAKRKGVLVKPGSFCWWFFRRPWLRLIPLRPFLMGLYTKLKGALT